MGVQSRGGWNFMSFCSKLDLIDDSLCQQPYTASGSGLAGSQLAVSPSYQTTYASVSFQSPGTWLGVTFRKQFMRALQVIHVPPSSARTAHCFQASTTFGVASLAYTLAHAALTHSPSA